MAEPLHLIEAGTRPTGRPFAVRFFWPVLGGGLLAIPLLIGVHIAVGSADIGIADTFRALFGSPASDAHDTIVNNLRLPRALVAVLAGAMLGMAGALLQSITRNPLAEPGLLGVTGGAVLAITAYIVLIPDASYRDAGADSGLPIPLVGMVGGLLAGATVYALSRSRTGGVDPMRLILIGVLVASVVSSFASLLLVRSGDYDTRRLIQWTVGSTGGRVWAHFHTIWPIALVTLPLSILAIGWANVLQLGDDVARGLGLRVERTRLTLLVLAAALTAGAVSVVGAIGFIGLIGPHAARLSTGSNLRRQFPLSMVFTALLLLVADIVARTATIGWVAAYFDDDAGFTASLPVGATTALLGAPFFLYLLLRRKTIL
ncbi:MAG: iron ABC transporter permease [Actinomycetota bacterium]